MNFSVHVKVYLGPVVLEKKIVEKSPYNRSFYKDVHERERERERESKTYRDNEVGRQGVHPLVK